MNSVTKKDAKRVNFLLKQAKFWSVRITGVSKNFREKIKDNKSEIRRNCKTSVKLRREDFCICLLCTIRKSISYFGDWMGWIVWMYTLILEETWSEHIREVQRSSFRNGRWSPLSRFSIWRNVDLQDQGGRICTHWHPRACLIWKGSEKIILLLNLNWKLYFGIFM